MKKDKNYTLGEVEMEFMQIIWGNEPIASGAVVMLADEKLSWKKSTTYTIIRKLCDRGILQNANGTVSSLLSYDDYLSGQSSDYVDKSFGGSLPSFLAAFSKGRTLSPTDKEEILKIINGGE